MPLPTTNISLNAIHIEVGGTTLNTVSLNDTDVRGMSGPDLTYAGAEGINTTSGTTISIGEFRNGQNLYTPTGTWILAKSSLLSSTEWTFYVQTTESATVANGVYIVVAQVGATVIAKETATHLEIWIDAGDNVNYARAMEPDDTIIEPGFNAYKIWSYELPTGVSGFTVKNIDSKAYQEGSIPPYLSESSVSGYDSLSSTAGSLSNDRATFFYTTATAQNSQDGNSWIYQAYKHDLTLTFYSASDQYQLEPSFRIWYKGEARNNECFDANTLVQMADGSVKAISLIELGDMTKGGEVYGTHKFLGGSNGYNYKGVILSGTHWVVENGRVMDVKDSVLAEKVLYIPDYWYSLTTEDNRIWANDVEFYDEGCMDFTSLNKYAQALINKDEEEIKKWGDKSTELSGGLEQRYLGINK